MEDNQEIRENYIFDKIESISNINEYDSKSEEKEFIIIFNNDEICKKINNNDLKEQLFLINFQFF